MFKRKEYKLLEVRNIIHAQQNVIVATSAISWQSNVFLLVVSTQWITEIAQLLHFLIEQLRGLFLC